MTSLADQLLTPPPQGGLPPPVRLDRTTLENYATCPARGLFAERNPDLCGSPPATAGQEGHEVLSWAIAQYIEYGEMPFENMEAAARMTRPDVQPEVLASIRPVIYSLGRLLRKHHPADILRYDGGEGERSGQLAAQLLPANETRGPILFTAEVDLLMATRAETVLRIIDWKTGRKEYTYSDVADLFQAGAYAFLVHRTYPDVERVEFQVCMTRMNRWTAPVSFTKRDATDMEGRLLQAVEYRRQALALPDGQVPETWPGKTKCLWCPKLLGCDHAHHAAKAVGDDPAGFLDTLLHLEAQVKQRRALLDKYADKYGPVVSAAGIYDRHPVEKPKKRPYSFRETKGDGE